MSAVEQIFTIQNITLFIAVWGAVLSTLKIAMDYLKDTQKIRVMMSFSLMAMGNQVSPPMLTVTAINHGSRPVTLTSVGVILPGDKYCYFTQTNARFPFLLSEDNPKCDAMNVAKTFALELKDEGYSGKLKMKGFYKSATGKFYKSKTMKFDLEGYSTYSGK